MKKIGGSNYKGFDPIEAGTHPAIFVRRIDLGTQEDIFQGHSSFIRKVLLGFEVPTARYTNDDGEEHPRIMYREYTESMGPKAWLRKHFESWRGKAYTPEEIETEVDIDKALGRPALITIVHKVGKSSGRTYGELVSIVGFPKGSAVPAPELDILTYDMGDAVPEWMPKRTREQIEVAQEMQPENQMPAPGDHSTGGQQGQEESLIQEDEGLPF